MKLDVTADEIQLSIEDLKIVLKFWEHFGVQMSTEDVDYVNNVIASGNITDEQKLHCRTLICIGQSADIPLNDIPEFKVAKDNAKKIAFHNSFNKDVGELVSSDESSE